MGELSFFKAFINAGCFLLAHQVDHALYRARGVISGSVMERKGPSQIVDGLFYTLIKENADKFRYGEGGVTGVRNSAGAEIDLVQ